MGNGKLFNKNGIDYKVTSAFGIRNIPSLGLFNNYHIGVDYAYPQGTELVFPVEVEIIKAYTGGDYGGQVYGYNAKLNRTLFHAHVSRIDVKVGQVIKAGTVVGLSGGEKGTHGAGLSTGAHLHTGVAYGRKTDTYKGKMGDGTWVDPNTFDFTIKEEVADGTAVIKKGAKYKSKDPKYNNRNVPSDVVGKAYAYTMKHAGEKDWVYFPTLVSYVHVNDVDFDGKDTAPTPQPTFKPYNVLIKKGTTLYKPNGTAYDKKTTEDHTVTIIKENNGLGLFRASWLIGVSEAWHKLNEKQPTPTAPTAPKVTYANMKGNTRLFVNSTGSETYPYDYVKKVYTHNTYQNLAARSAKVLKEANGRVYVSVPTFSPKEVWLNKSEITLTAKATYKIK